MQHSSNLGQLAHEAALQGCSALQGGHAGEQAIRQADHSCLSGHEGPHMRQEHNDAHCFQEAAFARHVGACDYLQPCGVMDMFHWAHRQQAPPCWRRTQNMSCTEMQLVWAACGYERGKLPCNIAAHVTRAHMDAICIVVDVQAIGDTGVHHLLDQQMPACMHGNSVVQHQPASWADIAAVRPETKKTGNSGRKQVSRFLQKQAAGPQASSTMLLSVAGAHVTHRCGAGAAVEHQP